MKSDLIACFAAAAAALLACGMVTPAAAFDLARPTINVPRPPTATIKPGVANSAGGTNVGMPALDAASKDAAKMTVPLGGSGGTSRGSIGRVKASYPWLAGGSASGGSKGTTVIKHGDSGARCRAC